MSFLTELETIFLRPAEEEQIELDKGYDLNELGVLNDYEMEDISKDNIPFTEDELDVIKNSFFDTYDMTTDTAVWSWKEEEGLTFNIILNKREYTKSVEIEDDYVYLCTQTGDAEAFHRDRSTGMDRDVISRPFNNENSVAVLTEFIINLSPLQ